MRKRWREEISTACRANRMNEQIVRVHIRRRKEEKGNIKKKKRDEKKKERGSIEPGEKIQSVRWLTAVFYTRPVYTTIPLTHSTLWYHGLKRHFYLACVLLQIVRLLHGAPLYSFAAYLVRRGKGGWEGVFSNTSPSVEVTVNRLPRMSPRFSSFTEARAIVLGMCTNRRYFIVCIPHNVYRLHELFLAVRIVRESNPVRNWIFLECRQNFAWRYLWTRMLACRSSYWDGRGRFFLDGEGAFWNSILNSGTEGSHLVQLTVYINSM